MNTVNKAYSSPLEAMTTGMKLVAALIVAFTLAVTVLLAGAASDNAYADVYASDASAQTDKAAASDEAAAADEEAIADDENPMSSGLDSAMVSTGSSVPLYAFTAIGIVAVAAFFVVGTRKLNSSISEMNKSIR